MIAISQQRFSRYFLLFLLFTVPVALYAQELKSPDQFLGYPLGSKYTPHYKIAAYFQYVATVMPAQVKLEQYGTTNEGRPLLLAAVASRENFGRLESIRQNNLRLAGVLTDQPARSDQPAIVWLSYNVHGNETSSSEVAMKMIYELLNPANSQSRKYLENTVVLIDPCLNPDGRDRYVHWLAQVQGKTVNPRPDAREHQEPWPGGRTNHYNFDLNRDWAWQTQVESRARIQKYNEWLPQVHSDYHEQGYNNPYYFAPAAEPYHEVITPFQRNFQIELGRNHARYFDANGWLYFTREVFDLLYPSYGDTYPTYSGSVGMTFEQGGLSRASTAVITREGDTLRLSDRIAHHFTTSMSTIELVSANQERVIRAFRDFYSNVNTNGSGDYKTYVVSGNSGNRLNALRKLLDNNGIKYTFSSGVGMKGWNFFSGKEEAFTTNNSLIVNTCQPKGVLARVLFEPKTKLADSATYDITAWALPYIYGINTWAVREKISGTQSAPASALRSVTTSAYAWLINYQSFDDARLLASLLKNGFRVRFAERDFTLQGKRFNRGTLIVIQKWNEGKAALLQQLTAQFDATVTSVATGFADQGFDFGSEKVHPIKAPKVAMITGAGSYAESAGEVWHYFDQLVDYPITLLNADQINNANWNEIDVLVVPPGYYKFLSDKDGSGTLKDWVRRGGKLIALDNAVSQMANGEWGVKLRKEEEKKDDAAPTYEALRQFAESEHDGIRSYIAGALFRVDLDTTHPLSFGLGEKYYTLKQDDKVFDFLKEGWNVGVLKKDNYVAGFVGSSIKPKISDVLSFGEQPMGNGTIVYLADNPIFRNFLENGHLLLANAVFLAGN